MLNRDECSCECKKLDDWSSCRYEMKEYVMLDLNESIITIKCFRKNVHIDNIKVLYYDRIDLSEAIDVDKISAPKERIICHYRYFLDKRFKFQPNVCNGQQWVAGCINDVCEP